MKQIRNSFTILIALLGLLTLTSCDEDDDAAMAYDITGYYSGVMQGNYYSWRDYDTSYTWETEFYFDQTDNYGGTGEEHDYSRHYSSGRPVVSFFDWWIDHEALYLQFTDGSIVVARDYEFTGRSFRGYFDTLDGEQLAVFDLVKQDRWLW